MAVDRADTIVLGAGIAGCALAYHLAGRKVGPVVLYDPQTPSAGATGRAAGVVTEQLWNEWDVEVARASKNEYRGARGPLGPRGVHRERVRPVHRPPRRGEGPRGNGRAPPRLARRRADGRGG